MIIDIRPWIALGRAAEDLLMALGLEEALRLGIFEGVEARRFERLARRLVERERSGKARSARQRAGSRDSN